VPRPKYIIGVPCLTRLLPKHNGTKLHDNRPAHQGGATRVAQSPPYATDPGSRRDKQKRMGAGRRCQEGHKVGEFSIENERGPGLSIA
jgi:hypothetical protein